MKKLILSALCAVPLLGIGQTLLYNDGAMIKVQPGATLFVEGGIHNTASGTIDNDGTIEVQGNFLNEGTWDNDDPNTLRFSGNTHSDVTPGSAEFYDVVIQKDATFNVNLLGHMYISNLLNFNAVGAAKVVTGNFDVQLGPTATVTGDDSNEYVATTGTGGVEKAVTADGSFVFPIGDLTNYTPLEADYTGSGYTDATIRTRVNNVVHPDIPTDASDFIDRYWEVNADGIADYNNTLTGTYIPGDLTGSAPLVKGAVYDGAEWTYFDAAAGANTVTGSTGEEQVDFTGTNFFGKVDIIAFLQGAYNTGTGMMTTTLTSNATIKAQMLTSPYVDAPATVADIPAGITDWVKLELRDPASPTTVLGRTSAFVRNNGQIVGLDGTSLPLIKNGLPTSIVSVFHRNHLAIRTPNAGIDVVNPISYSFADSLSSAFDGPPANDAMKLMSNGKYVMWGGNGNDNANTRFLGPANDRDYLLGVALGGNTTAVITNIYSYADYNMNGVVRFLGPANDRDFLLAQVLSGNTTTVITRSH